MIISQRLFYIYRFDRRQIV